MTEIECGYYNKGKIESQKMHSDRNFTHTWKHRGFASSEEKIFFSGKASGGNSSSWWCIYRSEIPCLFLFPFPLLLPCSHAIFFLWSAGCTLSPLKFHFNFLLLGRRDGGGKRLGMQCASTGGIFFLLSGVLHFLPIAFSGYAKHAFLKRICTLFPGLEFFRFDYLAKYGKCVCENFNFTILPCRWLHCHRRPPPPFGRWAGPYSAKKGNILDFQQVLEISLEKKSVHIVYAISYIPCVTEIVIGQ